MTLIDINEFSDKKTSIKLHTLDFYLWQPNEGGQGNSYCPYTAGWNLVKSKLNAHVWEYGE